MLVWQLANYNAFFQILSEYFSLEKQLIGLVLIKEALAHNLFALQVGLSI